MKAYSVTQDGRDSSYCGPESSIERGIEANITAIRCEKTSCAIASVLTIGVFTFAANRCSAKVRPLAHKNTTIGGCAGSSYKGTVSSLGERSKGKGETGDYRKPCITSYLCARLIRHGEELLWIRLLKILKILFWSRTDLLGGGFLKIFQFLGIRVDPAKANLLADSVETYEKTNLSIEP